MKNSHKKEAVLRMNRLGLSKAVIDDFATNGTVYVSTEEECQPADENIADIIREFERKTGYTAYHGILSDIDWLDMVAILYVTKYTEDYDISRNDIEHQYVCAWVYNFIEDFAEMGYIGIEPKDGHVIRTE